jgi:hypothetical protein
MNSRRRLSVSFAILLALTCTVLAQTNQDIPHLQKHGSVIQLYVEGKPFLMLGGELHNSSSSSLDYMQPIWPRLASMNLNTVLTPVSWELIEPQEGKFDFRLVDGLINAAHANKLRLVFLWFGSWKNTYSSYVPEWVKRDEKGFPRVLLADGRPTERLSPFSESNRKADALAFSKLMKHIREVDSAQTVLMIQVENEVGVIPEARDYSPVANTAFAAAVPKPLMEYLKVHSDTLSDELRNAWIGAGKRTTGNWEEVFGKSPLTSDLFMAWQYATYIDAVAAAGKASYPLPMYTNAALIRPNYQPGQYNSGGPLPHSIDIYRAGAPHLDFLSPDIYFDNFAEWVSRYHREGNAVFVPEAKGGSLGAANALYVFGQLGGMGFSPFAIDGEMEMPAAEKPDSIERPIRNSYAALAHLSDLILKKQGTDEIRTVLLEGEAQRSAKGSIGGYDVNVFRPAGGAGKPVFDHVSVLLIQTAPDEFLAAGSGPAIVSFTNESNGTAIVGIASIDEIVLVNGEWKTLRRLNGDENGQGQVLRLSDSSELPTIYRVRLYRY